MSCNTFIPIMDLVREVEALLAANYIDKDDPRITGGVFTNPTIKEGFLLDVQAREEFCRLVQECGLDAPFGKMWLSRPLYPDQMFVSYEDSGEPQTKWKTIQAVLESAGVLGPEATSLSSRLAAEIQRNTDRAGEVDSTIEQLTADTTATTDALGDQIANNDAAITAEVARAVAIDASISAAVDNLQLKDESLQSQVDSIGGGKKAYTTEAQMIADKDNIAANSSVDVINDPTPSKNGTYAYDGTTFTKSPYDPLTLSKTYTDSKATVVPKWLGVPTDLNTLQQAGSYINSVPANGTTELNYPVAGATGYLEVTGAQGTSAKYQKFTLTNGRVFQRSYNGAVWGAWKELGAALTQGVVDPFLTSYALKSQSLTYVANIGETDSLNDLESFGVWSASIKPPSNWAELGYPEQSVGMLHVESSPTSSQVYQTYRTKQNRFLRYKDGATPWTPWTPLAAGDKSFFVKGVLTGQDLNDFKTLGVYLKNSGTTGSLELNYPTLNVGVLKVYKGDVTSLIIQEYMAVTGSVYIRFWNSIEWSAWVPNSPAIAGGGGDSINYTKTVGALHFYMGSAEGTNAVRISLLRRTDPGKNQDVWGIGACEEVGPGGEVIKPITSAGVWETAIVAAENVGDHSGGGHGDEVLQSAYFMVDGMYRDQGFADTGAAKEIKFYQKSTIYIEAKPDVLCYKEIVWTFNSKGLNLKQKLTFPTAKVLNTSWIAMLPVLRKTNQDNTGIQVTDTEIRSQDAIVIDASEPDFPKRDLLISSGDSISLSSVDSGIAAELTVNSISAGPTPQAFVQNTTPYNKIYVQGTAIGVPYTTEAGEIWEIDVSFRVTTAN